MSGVHLIYVEVKCCDRSMKGESGCNMVNFFRAVAVGERLSTNQKIVSDSAFASTVSTANQRGCWDDRLLLQDRWSYNVRNTRSRETMSTISGQTVFVASSGAGARVTLRSKSANHGWKEMTHRSVGVTGVGPSGPNVGLVLGKGELKPR